MESVECADIIRRHPELILVSYSPVTWEGMLSVPVNLFERRKVRLKLTLPNFPRCNDASLKFGGNSAILFNREFEKKLNSLLKDALSVTLFLRQLQILIGEILHHKVSSLMRIDDYSVISELEAVICSPCEVKLSSSLGLNLVKLVLQRISVVLKRDTSCSETWKIVSGDLAQLQGSELAVGAMMSLRDAANKLEKQVKSLENVWEHLQDIDRNCWVIDPLVPKPHHLYRRIRITSSLSILISINPSQPSSLPTIRILGSDSEVLKYRAIVSDNFEIWNPNITMSENLLLLLNLQEFPQIPESNTENQKDNGLFNDGECCICFSLESNEDELPDRLCDNDKCQKHFHTACLLQWLQAIPGNQVVFNQLYGTCPYCGQNIPCPVEEIVSVENSSPLAVLAQNNNHGVERIYSLICGNSWQFVAICGLSDTLVAGIGLMSAPSGAITRSLTFEARQMYLSSSIALLNGVLRPVMRSIISKSVSGQNVGKVFSLVISLESLSALGGAPLFTQIYSHYLPPIYLVPVYLISASFHVALIFFVVCLEVAIRKSRNLSYAASVEDN